MNLAFCEKIVIERWAFTRVARVLNRGLAADHVAEIENTSLFLDSLRRQSVQIACSMQSAAAVITSFYKDRSPLAGATEGFPTRKALAREALKMLLKEIAMLSPTAKHFEIASQLWLTYCEKGIKEAFAGFADYLDAALIQNPPSGNLITHVVVAHPHLPYILRKAKSKAFIQHFRS